MNRRVFLKAAGSVAVMFATGCTGDAIAGFSGKKQPNFVFFLIDDMGWVDLGCYGSKLYETPNIDKLASEGMLFTDAYSSNPVCSPTRASIMTGKYPSRLKMDGLGPCVPKPDAYRKLLTPITSGNLPLEEKTIAESLKEAGYKTFFAGKWHLHTRAQYKKNTHYPEKQGFDVNMGGNHTGQPRGGYFSPYENPQLPDGPEGEYLTDRLTTEAIKFIKQNKDKPFFTYMSYYTVHTPIQAKEETVEKYKEKIRRMGLEHPRKREDIRAIKEGKRWSDSCQNNAEYAAMVEHLDENVGRILDSLKDNGLENDTVIIFASDNGGLSTGSPTGATSTLPLRGGKAWVYEGGIRTPAIIKCPGTIKAGSISDEPIISMDYYPTMLGMAGLPQNPDQHMDGVNLTPLLKGGKIKRDALYFHFPYYHHINSMGPAGAIRAGDYKLVERFEDMTVELYNLKDDIGERKDLSRKEPEVTAKLKKMLYDWRKETGTRMPVVNDQYRPEAISPADKREAAWSPTELKYEDWPGYGVPMP